MLPIDHYVQNAGYGILGAIEEVSIEDVRTNFETNVFGTLSVIEAALPLLRAQGNGHFLPVSNVGALLLFQTLPRPLAVSVPGSTVQGAITQLGESVPVWAGLYRTSAFTRADIDCAGDAVSDDDLLEVAIKYPLHRRAHTSAICNGRPIKTGESATGKGPTLVGI